MRAQDQPTAQVLPIAWDGAQLSPIDGVVFGAKLGFNGTEDIVLITKLGFDCETLPMSVARNTLLWYGDMVVAPLLFVLLREEVAEGEVICIQPSQVRCLAAPLRIGGASPPEESPAFASLELAEATAMEYLPCSELSLQFAASSAKERFKAMWSENAVIDGTCVSLKDTTVIVESLRYGVELMKRAPDTCEGEGQSDDEACNGLLMLSSTTHI